MPIYYTTESTSGADQLEKIPQAVNRAYLAQSATPFVKEKCVEKMNDLFAGQPKLDKPSWSVIATDGSIRSSEPCERITVIEKALQSGDTPHATSFLLPEQRIAFMAEYVTRNPMPTREKLVSLWKTAGAHITELSPKPMTSNKVNNICPAYEDWHPMDVLEEFNRVRLGQFEPLTVSIALKNVESLPKKELCAHSGRIGYLKAYWQRQKDQQDMEVFDPGHEKSQKPIDGTVPLTADDG